MRISDWISDVFSSDLIGLAIDAPHRATWFAGRCGRYCLCHDPDGLFARNHIGSSGNAKRAKAEHVGRRLSQKHGLLLERISPFQICSSVAPVTVGII